MDLELLELELLGLVQVLVLMSAGEDARVMALRESKLEYHSKRYIHGFWKIMIIIAFLPDT